MARLFVVCPGQATVLFDLSDGVTTIGRHGDNDLVLNDPSTSAFHAQIIHQNGLYLLKDLQSTNGTAINGLAITEAALKGGDTIEFGAVVCRFQEQVPPPGRPILKPQRPLPGSSTTLSGQRGLPEDARTLTEFYPAPQMRHRVHSEFAHRFLPQYALGNPYAFVKAVFDTQYPVDGMTVNRFIQSRWMMYEEIAGLIPTRPIGKMIFRRVLDLEISARPMPYGPVALVQMPVPRQCPEAFFIGVVLLNASNDPASWTHEVKARYFVLEQIHEDPTKGVLCEWTLDGRQNFGRLIPGDATAFLEVIGLALQKS